MKRYIIALVLFIIAIAAFIYFFTHRVSADIETKGDEGITAMISLATAVVTLATAIVTLVTKLIKERNE